MATQRSPGSLQRALLESLSAALAEIVNAEGTLDRVARVLIDAGSVMLDKRLADLRAGLGRSLLSWVRQKTGDHVGDLIEEFAAALTQSEQESLTNRLNAAGENDIVEQLASFVSDVVGLAGDRRVHLALDDVDRLDDSDLRRLTDLVASLPSAAQIRLTFTVWDSEQRDRADGLVLGGVSPTPLGGLDVESIGEWIDREGLPATAVAAVVLATNGYPLHVGDAIELVKGPDGVEALSGFGPDDVIETRTRLAWRGLDQETQLRALKLAVYSSPLNTERACAVLDIDVATWSIVTQHLVQAAFMIDGDVRWFHNLRRQALWRSVAPTEMEELAYETAAAELLDVLGGDQPPTEAYIDFALVAPKCAAVMAGKPSVAQVVDASRDEIAVMASMIEIAEHEGPVALAADAVSHAMTAFGLTADPVETLERLEARELVTVVSNEYHSAIVARFNCQEAADVTMGRAARELSRLPTPRLATSIMNDAVIPLTGRFNLASFGIGYPTVSSMAQTAYELITRPSPQRATYLESGSALLFRARTGGVPFHAAISYEDVDAAQRSVLSVTGTTMKVQGRALDIDLAIAVPGQPVASQRFIRAVSRLYDRRFSSTVPRAVQLDEPMDPIRHLESKLEIYDVIGRLCSERERFAYDLTDPRGAAYHLSDGTLLTFELRGRAGLHALPDSFADAGFEQYARFRVGQALGLDAGATVSTIHSQRGGLGAKDPLTEVVLDLAKSAEQFNKAQTNRHLRMIGSELEAAISLALQQTFDDAMALRTVSQGHTCDLTPFDFYFLIEDEVPQGGWTPGARSSYSYITVPSPAEHDRVFVQMVPPREAENRWLTTEEIIPLTESTFGLEPGNAHVVSSGEMLHSIPELLGYESSELRLDHG